MKKRTSVPVIVTVHRPELTPEERETRMQRIHDAAAALLIAQTRAHAHDANPASGE